VNVKLTPEDAKTSRYRVMLGDLVRIADRFNVDLKIPSKLKREDLEAIALIKTYMENGTLDLSDISMTIVKSKENKDDLPEQLATGKGFFRFTNEQLNVEILGTPIRTGPVAMDVDAEVKDLTVTLEKFHSARIGDGVRLSFQPLGPVHVLLLWGAGPME
jgi:hypothetical protein